MKKIIYIGVILLFPFILCQCTDNKSVPESVVKESEADPIDELSHFVDELKSQVNAETNILLNGAYSYYSEILKDEQKLKIIHELSRKAMWDESVPVPATASGSVMDRWGIPITGAVIVIEKESTNIVLGSGTTSIDGRFVIALTHTNYSGLTLLVTKSNYMNWAMYGFYGGIKDYPVRMDREFNQKLFDEIVNQRNHIDRLKLIMEIIGNRSTDIDDTEKLFPYIGNMRNDFRKVIVDGHFERNDNRFSSPSGRAQYLLDLWHDPRDIDPEKSGYRRPSRTIAARMISDTCELYATYHFTEQKVKQRPMYFFSRPVFDSGHTRAYITFEVDYAHWGYREHLVLMKEKLGWTVKIVIEGANLTYE